MRRGFQLVVMLAAVVAAASLSCLFTGHFLKKGTPGSHDEAHLLIHRQLGLTPDQVEQLKPVEERFAEQRRHYGELIQVANQELAEAILRDKADSPSVRAAVDKIHRAQDELQKATLEHVFAMRGMLTPEQYEKLLKLTAEALRELDDTH